mmetsp:Transcript_19841/g.60191  ORF Transcript_19841/g.60191 Transcript_19841/m.60191 type:complete len:240 (+) Transcript_19841:622-1341(+)
MVLREAAQALPRPTPVLKHLRRRLDEISWTLGEGCTIAVSFRTDAMHDMPKFMKKCDAVGVTQQGRSAICGGCRQVAQHAIDRYLALPPLEEVENRSVAIFALSRMEVEIEEAHPLAACCVHHTKKAHLRMPSVELVHLMEDEAEKLLINRHCGFYHMIERKVRTYRLLINAMFTLQPLVRVEAHIMRKHFHSVSGCVAELATFTQVSHLELPQRLKVTRRATPCLFEQWGDERLNCTW